MDLKEIVGVCGTQREVAEHLGVTPQEVNAWVQRGFAPGRKFYEYRDGIAELAKQKGLEIDPRDIP